FLGGGFLGGRLLGVRGGASGERGQGEDGNEAKHGHSSLTSACRERGRVKSGGFREPVGAQADHQSTTIAYSGTARTKRNSGRLPSRCHASTKTAVLLDARAGVVQTGETGAGAHLQVVGE